jgi:hypothetical protein
MQNDTKSPVFTDEEKKTLLGPPAAVEAMLEKELDDMRERGVGDDMSTEIDLGEYGP